MGRRARDIKNDVNVARIIYINYSYKFGLNKKLLSDACMRVNDESKDACIVFLFNEQFVRSTNVMVMNTIEN